jgi:hypothetical protein
MKNYHFIHFVQLRGGGSVERQCILFEGQLSVERQCRHVEGQYRYVFHARPRQVRKHRLVLVQSMFSIVVISSDRFK